MRQRISVGSMDNEKLCRLFFTSLEVTDHETIKNLCADTFAATQNGGPAIDVDALIGFNAHVHNVVPDFHYSDAICKVTDNGFVEEHSVRGTLPDGAGFEFKVCLVGEVADGKITTMREYADTGAAAAFLAAIRPG